MDWLHSLNEWAPWFALVGGGFGVLGWAIGLPSVLRILAGVVDVIAPILKALSGAFIGAISWVWEAICWPALKDIFDNWRTAAFAIGLVLCLIWAMDARLEIKMDAVVDQLSACQNEVTKLQRTHKVRPGSDWLWPLW